MREVLVSLFLVGLIVMNAVGQSITIKRTDAKIVLDAEIEPAWFEADSAYDFMQYFPYDTSLAVSQTVARVLYDDQFIYVLGIMYNQSADRDYITPSLRRDFRGEANDSFSILLDCFKDKTNGFLFGINPFGVRREVLITGGGSGNNAFNPDWDNKWFGEAKLYGSYWVAEMAIPFKTLRFAEGAESWNVNFYRIDSEFAERSTWSPIERQFSIVNMATLREMFWDQPTGKPGTNISVIPYVASNYNRDFEEGTPAESNVAAGFDVKYAVTPGLNLDLTVNPDFSQVEVDQQVTNLDRFEIFFPERRQFFLENADLFSDYGTFSTRPFFSRRIGVSQDTATGQNIQNPIPFGARLSGKVNDDLRLGFLSMQTGSDDQNGLPSYNYTVLSLQQKVFDRSNVSFLVVNKQTFEDPEAFNREEFSQFNRTVGADFNLATANNRWNGKAFVHHTFEEMQQDAAYAAGLTLEYSDLRWSSRIFSQVVGAGYNPEAGFVRRTDIRQLAHTTRYSWYPESGGVQSHGPGFDFDLVWNSTYGFLDWDYNFLYDIRWRSTARFSMRLRQQYTYLFDPFDPSNTDGEELPAGTDYVNEQIIASYESDQRRRFFFELRTRSGDYFNGLRLNLGGSVGYRYQPFGFTSIDFNFNRIILPSPYTTTNLILIGPRFDFTFTKSIFFTTFVQYNSQLENLNINSRLQWRFKPVSDIFLVYTDNYFAYNDGTGFIRFGGPRVRALTFKITYWLNL